MELERLKRTESDIIEGYIVENSAPSPNLLQDFFLVQGYWVLQVLEKSLGKNNRLIMIY